MLEPENAPPLETPETNSAYENSVVPDWVRRLSKATRRYRVWRTLISILRAGTSCGFLGLMALYVFGLALAFQEGLTQGAHLFREPGLAQTFVASGAAEGWLIAWFGLTALTWAMQPERRYPALEANALDLRDINALARALKMSDAEVRGYVARRLCPLLVRVQAEDNGCFSPETQYTLCACLKIENARADFDLITAILALLSRVGDGEALPFVRELATAKHRYNAEERVVAAARDCLKILSLRHNKEQERTTLLRPTSGVAPAKDLLRPASSSATPPEFLLRSAASPGNSAGQTLQIEVKNAAS